MLSRDHYALLGVAPDADSETIDAAFRRLSRRYHPDLNPGDAQAQAAFERLKLAHSVLTDSRDRARYDREGRPPADEIEVLRVGIRYVLDSSSYLLRMTLSID